MKGPSQCNSTHAMIPHLILSLVPMKLLYNVVELPLNTDAVLPSLKAARDERRRSDSTASAASNCVAHL